MTRMEHTKKLRADQTRHYNCCQATLLPFCEECQLEKETAMKIASSFGSGMKHGSTCGAVTGGLMALGLCGADDKKTAAFLRKFKEKNGSLLCAELLAANAKNGGDKKTHCDNKVFDAVQMVEELL